MGMYEEYDGNPGSYMNVRMQFQWQAGPSSVALRKELSCWFERGLSGAPAEMEHVHARMSKVRAWKGGDRARWDPFGDDDSSDDGGQRHRLDPACRGSHCYTRSCYSQVCTASQAAEQLKRSAWRVHKHKPAQGQRGGGGQSRRRLEGSAKRLSDHVGLPSM
jgi:hypothetical protein